MFSRFKGFFNDDERPVLKSNDIKGVAEYMKSEKCKKVYIMAGAGISTSAGIPDFRTPGTGLYHNLQKLDLPRAEAVFDIGYFRENPIPFYILAKDMNPEHFRPTPTHSFFRLLHEKGLLGMCFTQNIDTLERRAGLAGDKIVEAHGSFATNSCTRCGTPFDMRKMKAAFEATEVARCERRGCGGLVKPDIVFFGEQLPHSFFQNYTLLKDADLLFIIGTSLTVHPFASLADMPPTRCPRVLINLDHVGDIGSQANDVLALGKCDDIVRGLCDALGWRAELERLWALTAMEAEAEPEDVVDKIVKDIEERLVIDEPKLPAIPPAPESKTAAEDPKTLPALPKDPGPAPASEEPKILPAIPAPEPEPAEEPKILPALPAIAKEPAPEVAPAAEPKSTL